MDLYSYIYICIRIYIYIYRHIFHHINCFHPNFLTQTCFFKTHFFPTSNRQKDIKKQSTIFVGQKTRSSLTGCGNDINFPVRSSVTSTNPWSWRTHPNNPWEWYIYLPSGKLTWLAGKWSILCRKYRISFMVHFPASYVSWSRSVHEDPSKNKSNVGKYTLLTWMIWDSWKISCMCSVSCILTLGFHSQ